MEILIGIAAIFIRCLSHTRRKKTGVHGAITAELARDEVKKIILLG